MDVRFPEPQGRRRRTALFLVPILLAGSALGLVASQPSGSLVAGTAVAGVDLGGLTLDQARARLKSAIIAAPLVTVRAGSRTTTVSADVLGWSVDVDGTLKNVQDVQGTLLTRVLDAVTNQKAKTPKLAATIDDRAARAYLADFTADLAKSPKDAAIVFDKARYAVRPDESGVKPDVNSAVGTYAKNPDATEVSVPLAPLPASVRASALQPRVDEGNLLMRPLTLKLEGAKNSLTLSPLQVANLYWVRRAGIELDAKTIEDAVKRADLEVGTPVQEARYSAKNGKLVKVPEREGLSALHDESVRLLSDAVLDAAVRSVTFPSEVTKPSLKAASLPDPKKLTLVAVGKSTYYGSSRARRTNVAVAAGKLDGLVVPTGGEFSFLNAVGHITDDAGFVSGLVISGGRTVAGLGGGVCQVSTTAFRALYTAGLPIVERNQHAYRVGYYEPNVGFEAAVYDPGVDLRMTNDTGGPLLIRTVNDDQKSTLEVRLYGVPQTRTVSVSPAVILSRTPAPAPQYIVNPSLAPGVRRQVDWAQDGYNLYITRTINDVTGTRTDKVSTAYRAWRAVYEVGAARTTSNN
ncbi:VanW family protein [Deinococcus yavapaiensis]|uniref:Vancomycin resistance protein YoaR n=1 Tax=Deinococcus yavapaiensis KR-236 TaxID=694435 RepID=A0A318S9H4_9DEIO|nr:VanW family protein [Deinococcus yavapaiensis]PYE55375.1 vancomycin resistance protein YoaR [Deinococcus yavapaiensis KR-236]